MNTSSTSAVTPGIRKVSSPTMMPSTPISASHQREPTSPPMIAWASARMPSTSANAPQNSTSVTSVMPGQMKASTPKMMAAMPRSRMSHQ